MLSMPTARLVMGTAIVAAAAAAVRPVPAVVAAVAAGVAALPLLIPALGISRRRRTDDAVAAMAGLWLVVSTGWPSPVAVAAVGIVASAVTVWALGREAGTTLTRVIRRRAVVDALTVAISTCLAARVLWEARSGSWTRSVVEVSLLASGAVAFAVAVVVWVQAADSRSPRNIRLGTASALLVVAGVATILRPDLAGRRPAVAAITIAFVLWSTARALPRVETERSTLGSRPLEVWLLTIAVVLAIVAVVVGGVFSWTDPVAAVLAVAVAVILVVRLHLDQREEAQMAADADAKSQAQTDELRRREERFRSLVAHSSDIVTLLDGDGIIRYQSLSVSRILGWEPDELLGHTIESVVFEDDRARVLAILDPSHLRPGHTTTIEARLVRRDGTLCQAETTISNLMGNAAVEGIVLTSRDMTVRKQLEEQLRHRAFYDALTGLGNRALFRDRLDHAAARVRRYGGNLAVMFLDLDGFKQVNDTAGHDAGDQLLVAVADRLRQSLRASDTIARMGGDEFAVLLEHPDDVRQAEAVAGKIVAALQLPIDISSAARLRVACSVGIDVAGGRYTPPSDELLRNADLAMYRAKALGKGRVQRFEPSLREAAVGRARMESELRRAVDNDELVLYFQPVVALPSGEITGVEALVRWCHPDRGLVPPTEFIPVAEESDLIIEIGRWAMARACMSLAEIPVPPGRSEPWVAVNVAARQLGQPGLVQAIRSALGRSSLDPGRLVLEITEGSLVDDPRATAALFYRLKELGVRLAIDDFGTGYSSLSRLRTFPVDKLKIDRSFIQEIVTPTDEAPIVAAVMAMAHSLGLTAVAEGVETLAQLTSLHAHGCEEAQGFLLARPLPASELPALLASSDRLLGGNPPLDERKVDGGMALMLSGMSQNVTGHLLTELARQARADAVWTASVESHGERVVEAHGGVAPGLVIARDGAGSFLQAVGEEVPAGLRSAGLRAVVTVPIFDESRNVTGMLGVGFANAVAPPSSTVVLLELFTRMLSEHAVAKADGGLVPSLS